MTYNWVIIKQNGMTITGQADTEAEAMSKMRHMVQDGFYFYLGLVHQGLVHQHQARYFIGSDVLLKEIAHAEIQA